MTVSWRKVYRAIACVSASLFLVPLVVSAGMLGRVSDTMSSSAPGMMSNHTIQFVATNGIPDEGTIRVVPAPGFSVPASFDHTDIDLAVAATSGAVFIDRDLEAASAILDTVVVTTGTESSFLFTLHAGSIAAGEIVQIEMGTNARHGTFGDQMISNPSTVGSYRIDIETKNGGGTIVDAWNTLVYLIEPVAVGPVNTIDDTPPIISNVLPPNNLLLQAGTRNVQIALNTSELAACRYSETQGTSFALMTHSFDQSSAILHTVILPNLSDDTTYTIYIVCADRQNNPSAEYRETFSIGVVPIAPGTGGVRTGPPGESGDGFGGGPLDFGGPYLNNSRVTLEGRAYPGSSVSILRDGTLEKKLTASSEGRFSTVVENLPRGTYTFGIFAEDSQGRRSSTYSTTISINANTSNTISRIFVPPTIAAAKTTLDPGEVLAISGEAIPGSAVEVFLGKQARVAASNVRTASTTALGSGAWSVSFDTAGLALETYEVKARSTVEGEDPGDFSAIVYVGIGGNPQPDYGLRADLNKDGKVNIVDFSILLFNWGTADTIADINLDGGVGLTDFSIMLYYWTG